jgi:Glycosyl transferase family 64 domain
VQVLSIDDDVTVPCGEVAAAFAAWQRTADQMVGWFPRGHLLAADCTPRYLLRDAAVLLRGHYSMVLTKVATHVTCSGLPLLSITDAAAVAA